MSSLQTKLLADQAEKFSIWATKKGFDHWFLASSDGWTMFCRRPTGVVFFIESRMPLSDAEGLADAKIAPPVDWYRREWRALVNTGKYKRYDPWSSVP